ncbi:efflux RND transporter periplasmic adaptor subunit [Butyrivibrio sp. INlla21]|uniref:efflux RND transporter periplasmic adaptor subunit n=1 Tax=Butyrivibrio sp. INlla21 TaxID=1520811 RepID=UPI0008ED3151|nr:efflux RND transporter periplasmic adaptor subunit [Butyrivibrio sp. INlla21]SFU89846.1 RND family efflux transporter, MFP subunit [Butyrivibrio sp. INlla21]
MAENKDLKKDVELKEEKETTPVVENKNEIKETTGSSVEIYDEDDDFEVEEVKKPKKKLKKKWIVLGIVALLLIFFIARAFLAGKNAALPVQTVDVANGTIENILSVSGTVESADSKSYFADVTAPVDQLNVKIGDKVASGDVLYTYDAAQLELAEKNAQLAIKQAKGNYSALYSGAAAADRDYAKGMNAQQINERLDAITAEMDALDDKITEKRSRMSKTLSDLNKTMLDVNQNGIADGTAESYLDGNDGYITRRENDNNDSDVSESNKQMSLALQESIKDVSYALENDPEIQGWEKQKTTLAEEQAHLSSAKAAQVNGGTASANKANMESVQLTQEDTIAKIQEAKDGIKADFNGVVTAVDVVEGATVAPGTKMITLANLDDVQVDVQVSKTDLPKLAVGQKVDITINGKAYTGEITQISGSATKNANGVAVVDTTIKVTNPDKDIILGVEANNKIHAEKAENTIVLPYEYVLTDADGDYVFVLENGVATRKDVKIGISTSTEAQIVEGLSVNDKVITTNLETLTDGMPVVAMEM